MIMSCLCRGLQISFFFFLYPLVPLTHLFQMVPKKGWKIKMMTAQAANHPSAIDWLRPPQLMSCVLDWPVVNPAHLKAG